MYLSECEEEEEVTAAICKKKMTEDGAGAGGVNGEMEKFVLKTGWQN